MYQIGDYVVKTGNGVCHIEDIQHLNMSDVDRNRLYYLLIPIEDKGAKLYVPVDNENSSIRQVMSRDEAWDMIHRIPQIEEAAIENDKLREQSYKEAIRSGRPEELIRIIKHTYLRRQKRTAQGKKTTATDERYFKMAEDKLYAELAFALGKDKGDMRGIITDAIKNI